MRTIVFYISGHGFGHASRAIELINTILVRSDDVRIVARTSAAKWLFDRTVATPLRDGAPAFRREHAETDTGAVQIDSLHLDEEATVSRAREFMRTFAARADAEARFLEAETTGLVIADIPPLGMAAAARAGVPAVGLGNFTWDWIYSGYADAQDLVAAIGGAYATADEALRLPMHGGFGTFKNIVDVPFVARRSRRDPDETRRALKLPRDKRLVLLSFGGYGLDRIDQAALARLHGYAVIGSAAHPLDEDAMYEAGFRYEDLVRAVDVVATKPGYGIISECIANETALLYTSRGRFIEYDVFVEEMPRYVRSQFMDHATLFSGDWQRALDSLLAQPLPPEQPAVNGAEVCADRLLAMC